MIVFIYLWSYFDQSPKLDQSMAIDILIVILAGTTAILSFVLYFLIPRKIVFYATLLIFYLLTSTIGLLVFTTGGLSSPYIVFWISIIIFSAIFNIWGILPIILAIGYYGYIQFSKNNLSFDVIFSIILSSILPIATSLIIWHKKSKKEEKDSDSKNYRDLANELSDITSKSEVVINAIGDGVIAIDGQGIIRLINPAAQRTIGWSKQDALALNYKSVFKLINQRGESLDSTNNPIQHVMSTNQQIRTNDFSIVTKNEKRLAISLVVSPVSETGSGVIAVFHDITKEKALERGQAEFVSTASHEMRTPVASIEGYLGLALNPQTAQVDNRARDYIQKAHESAQHLGHLFQDLLDVSKADDGRISNNPKVVNIVLLVNDIVEGLRQKASDKGLNIIYKPMPSGSHLRQLAPVYYVNLDNDHIREIMNNLIENAIKYTLNGEVVVDINGDDEKITLSVKDSGIGISADDITHLFQKFYRIDNKDTREIGGTGLGLYICRRLTEIMDGRIWAESIRGKGSTFFVELPRISNSEAIHLKEIEDIKYKQEIEKEKTRQMIASENQAQIEESKIEQDKTPKNVVPRSRSLTPEQIAEYVAKQRILAQKQHYPVNITDNSVPSNQQNSRPQSVSIPVRGPN
ncbi:MAG TPA: ATP-binding protein [Candidatus Saccharibacteria bacterium]|nr:ATP-binding protein [Candidatus Saccharibacteria bacterium]